MVSVDVTLVFSIRGPKEFVYKLGAARLDELLSGAVEEGIRALVRSTDHTEVYSLRGNRAGNLLHQLNEKFKETGVWFSDCKITAVWLPPELAQTLEATTKMRSQQQTVVKEHEFQALQVRQQAEMSVQEIQRKTEQLIVQDNGKKRMASIAKEQETINAEEKAKVGIAKAEEDVATRTTQAQSDLNRAKVQAEKNKMEQLNKAKMGEQEIKLQADLDAKMMTAESFIELTQSKQKAEAIKLEAKAETSLGEQIKKTRDHELNLERKKILAELAEHGDFNLVGAQGDAALKSLLDGEIKDSSGSGCAQQ